jgi:hypothetical protein
MNKITCFILIIMGFPICDRLNADDTIIKNIHLDASNTLLVRLQRKLLPKPAAILPQGPLPSGLPPGSHWGVPPDQELRTYDIVLVKDNTETVLNSFELINAVSIEPAFPGFRFLDWAVKDNYVYYVYIFKDKIYIAKLNKINDSFYKVNETSFLYDINMLDPMIYESPTHEIIFKLGRRAYKENTSNAFIETELPDQHELEKAKEEKQERNKNVTTNSWQNASQAK